MQYIEEINLVATDGLKVELLANFGQYQPCLSQSQVPRDANSRSRAEWYEVLALFQFRALHKPLRVILHWLWVLFWVVMYGPDIWHYNVIWLEPKR